MRDCPVEVFSKKNRRRRGAVMMEYVILATLIAAAAMIAIVVFGRTVVRESNVAAHATTGNGNKAATAQQGYQQEVKADREQAENYNKTFSDAGKCP